MNNVFEKDDFPGKPKILFIGWPDSSHTHAWIDLIRSDFNVRLFSLPRGLPPDSWSVRTYVTQSTHLRLNRINRRTLYPGKTLDRDLRNWWTRRIFGSEVDAPRLELAKIIKKWKPHVVHALGFDFAGKFLMQVRARFEFRFKPAWVLQLRGGSDLALSHADPNQNYKLAKDLATFDYLISDNFKNIEIVKKWGIPEHKFSKITPVPGTGGIDIDALTKLWDIPTGERKDILWPKAYECPWSKALPVFEAFKICQNKLFGRRIYLLAADEQTFAWFYTLPEELRRLCRISERIPRPQLLERMAECRIMLAPSLVDGFPNSVYEAMALGAFPIVSPLETITPVVEEKNNVLFARNLYPHEIAKALIRALSDDELVNAASKKNHALVTRLANRKHIKSKVINWYNELSVSTVHC